MLLPVAGAPQGTTSQGTDFAAPCVEKLGPIRVSRETYPMVSDAYTRSRPQPEAGEDDRVERFLGHTDRAARSTRLEVTAATSSSTRRFVEDVRFGPIEFDPSAWTRLSGELSFHERTPWTRSEG